MQGLCQMPGDALPSRSSVSVVGKVVSENHPGGRRKKWALNVNTEMWNILGEEIGVCRVTESLQCVHLVATLDSAGKAERKIMMAIINRTEHLLNVFHTFKSFTRHHRHIWMVAIISPFVFIFKNWQGAICPGQSGFKPMSTATKLHWLGGIKGWSWLAVFGKGL